MHEDDSNIVITEIRHHKFATLIIGSIVIAIMLVMAALALYQTSGTEALDLSRPDLEGARDQSGADRKLEEFSSDGPIDNKTIDEFMKLYDEQLGQVKKFAPFKDDVLSPKSLRIDAATAAKRISAN